VKEGEMGKACSTHWEIINAYKERQRPLGRPRSMWEDNIKIVLGEMGRGGMVWIHLAQDRDK
jgi:hypothetical protein